MKRKKSSSATLPSAQASEQLPKRIRDEEKKEKAPMPLSSVAMDEEGLEDLVSLLEMEIEEDPLSKILADDMKMASPSQLVEHLQTICDYIELNSNLDLSKPIDCLLSILEKLTHFPYKMQCDHILHILIELSQNDSFNYDKLPAVFGRILQLNQADRDSLDYVDLTTVQYKSKIPIITLIDNLVFTLFKKTTFTPKMIDAYKMQREILVSLLTTINLDYIPRKLTTSARTLKDKLLPSKYAGEIIKDLCALNRITILAYLAVNAGWDDVMDALGRYKTVIEFDKSMRTSSYQHLLIVPSISKNGVVPSHTIILKSPKKFDLLYAGRAKMYIKDDTSETKVKVKDIKFDSELSKLFIACDVESVTYISSKIQVELFNQCMSLVTGKSLHIVNKIKDILAINTRFFPLDVKANEDKPPELAMAFYQSLPESLTSQHDYLIKQIYINLLPVIPLLDQHFFADIKGIIFDYLQYDFKGASFVVDDKRLSQMRSVLFNSLRGKKTSVAAEAAVLQEENPAP